MIFTALLAIGIANTAFESTVYIKSEGMSVWAQNESALFVSSDTFFGKTIRYTNKNSIIESKDNEIIRLAFIKSLRNEYIEAVSVFMNINWIKELFKGGRQVYIELRGRETVHLEGYCRIEDYSRECIKLGNGEYLVGIIGQELELRHLSEQAIAIDGRIDRVEFL